jgi:CHAD domain-containing protein
LEDRQTIYSSPAHLLQESWVDFQYRAAVNLLFAMEAELKKLKLRITVDRVHKSRVSLRRWYSVWGFLAEDGWEEKKFKKKVLAPLREFLKELGDLRDCDVNIQTAEKLECDAETLDGLRQVRKKLKLSLEESLAEIDPARITADIDKYLEHKASELSSSIEARQQEDHSAFAHFDRYLSAHEEQVKKLSEKASTPESLHKLRLAIKKWRYLLTECMGLTTLELVRAQTLLGEIHDFDRLEPVLKDECEQPGALSRLRQARAELIHSFEQLKNHLPFGLRPGTISYVYCPDQKIDD